MKRLNNKGFTLMEVIVAMALVTLVASFVGSAIVSAQKNTLKTQELSAGMDDAFVGSEEYLADSSAIGSTDGNYKLTRVSGGLNDFPEIDLAIRDSSNGTDDAVKYVAFKRSEDNENILGGGGSVSNSGGGVTEGSGNNGGEPAQGGGIKEEEPPKEPEMPEQPQQPEQPQEPEQPQTPQQPEIPDTPQIPNGGENPENSDRGGKDFFFGYRHPDMKDHFKHYDWWRGHIVDDRPPLDLGDGIVTIMEWSKFGDWNTNGILVTTDSELRLGQIHDEKWNCNYRLVIHSVAADGSNGAFYEVNGVKVKAGGSYTVPTNDGGGVVIKARNKDVYITGISVEKVD